MSILSFKFIIFVLVFELLYYILPFKKISQKLLLIVVSLFFYASFGISQVIVLASEIVISYILGKNIQRNRRPLNLIISIVLCTLPLLYFKYSGFASTIISSSLGKVLPVFAFPDQIHSIIVPVGISFYTFKIISYLVEIYKNNLYISHSLLDYAVYISFFPTILSGPIDRPDAFLIQLHNTKKFDQDIWIDGVLITLFGYFEKTIVADRLGVIVNHVFGNYSAYPGFPLFFTSILYSLQIYLDFCGYSLIVVGIAKSLGITCTNNFSEPYFSRNIHDFWKRWHISLSTWLRDYIYFPLGGNRKGNLRKNLNVMITFLISGLWHGAGWNFIIWGAIHGLCQIAENIIQPIKTKLNDKLNQKNIYCFNSLPIIFIQIAVTFLIVNFAWVFFWSSDHTITAFHIIQSMFKDTSFNFDWLHDTGIHSPELLISFLSCIIIFIVDILRYQKKGLCKKYHALNTPSRFLLLLCLIFTILICSYNPDEFNPENFLYFRF